jgi:hypothetical protein
LQDFVMASDSFRSPQPFAPSGALKLSRCPSDVCGQPLVNGGQLGQGHAGRLLITRAILAAAAVTATTGVAAAHHSLAMFDRDHPIELLGTVQEFRFTSPHTYILLKVERPDGDPVIWDLEGNSPNNLAWDGWSSTTIRPGDKLRLRIEPLRNGSPGGAWNPRQVSREDGTAVVPPHRYGPPR